MKGAVRWGGRESVEIRRKIHGDAKKWMEHVGPWILPRSVERELQGGPGNGLERGR